MKKNKSVINTLTALLILCCFLGSQNLFAAAKDVFLKLKGIDGQICQGTLIEDKILTSALCFCPKVEEPFAIFKKEKPKKITILQTSNDQDMNQDIVVDAKIYFDELACRFLFENRNPESASSKMIYDRYFFDLAIIEILNVPSVLSKTKGFPNITCARPEHNILVEQGVFGVLTRQEKGEVILGRNHFRLSNKPNQWHEDLEVFFTGYRKTTQDDFFTADVNQNGAPILSLTKSLLKEQLHGDLSATSFDKDKLTDILEGDDFSSLYIPGIVTHAEPRLEEVEGRAIYAMPFFNSKKLLIKHISSKYLSHDCLNDKNPTGFTRPSMLQIY